MVFGFLTRKAVTDNPSQTEEGETQSRTSLPPKSPSPAPESKDEGSGQGPRDIQSFYKLVKTMPPKVLHNYTVTRLRSQEEDSDLSAVLSFFSELQPPPLLHCVRCHNDFFEVENNDRSCQMEHDDDSAEVEKFGGDYETTYYCCDQTVEGEGDMGPPDGWCYEGEHTTDRIRARYRADSTPRDPKLTPCSKSCHPVPASAGGSRKRRRVKESESEDDQEEEEDSGVEEITGVSASPDKAKTKSLKSPAVIKKRATKKARISLGEAHDANNTTEAEGATSPAPKKHVDRKPRKSRSKKQEPTENLDADTKSSVTKKSQIGRSPKMREHADSDTGHETVKPSSTPQAKAKRKATTGSERSPSSPKTPSTNTKSHTKSTSPAKPRSTKKKSLKEVVLTSIEGEE